VGEWLVDDQRFAASRTDVLVYKTDALKEPLRVAGQPWAHLSASTSGSDSDWVVKVIDVWPDEVPITQTRRLPADALGRHPARPLPRGSGQPARHPTRQGVGLHGALAQRESHVPAGSPHHVQIQSTWFPLYDRNPQKYVSNIMSAKPEDFTKATQRIWHAAGSASSIDFPVVDAKAQ